VLRNVQTDRSSLLHGRLLRWQFDTVTLAHRCRRGASTPSPIAMLETSNQLPAEQELGTAFLSMNTQPLGPEILSRLALDGFTTPGPELYANTAEKWRVLQSQE